jgi:hypothetical protein
VKPLTSMLRRLAVPLVGASLAVAVIIIAIVVLDLGGSTGDAASSIPVIQIGNPSAVQGSGGATSTGSTTQGQSGASGTGSTIRAGKTTVVTGDIRVQTGLGHQGGSPSTGGAQGPSTTGPGG